MKVSQVTKDDGRACAYLLNFLKQGRWDLNGSEAEELVKVKAWVGFLANSMASELKSSVTPPAPEAPAPSPAAGFKVKSMGKLPPSKPAKKKK